MVAHIALEVVISACTWDSLDNRLVIFTVKALRILFATHISHCFTEEALAVSVATIVRRPKLIVRAGLTRSISAFALCLMKLLKVDVGQKGAFTLSGHYLSAVSELVKSVRPVDHELLRHAIGLDDDVFNV